MSHKYSSVGGSSGNRRKSIFTPNINNTNLNEASAQTIELERLEQEITLTLQSIDKAFAKSHKIINDRLIPIVKKYHNSSKKIWQGVSFWKNFLETSANVELRGYEEAVQNQEFTEDQVSESQDQGSGSQETHTGGDTVQLNEQLSPVKTDGATTAGGDVIGESTNHTIQQFQNRYTENFNDTQQDHDISNFKSSTPNKLKHNNPIMPQIDKNNNLGFDTTDSILPPIPVSANLSNTNGTDVNQTTPTLQRSNTDIQPKNYILHNNLDTNYKIQVSPRKKHPHQPAVNSLTPKKPPQKKRKSIYAQKYDSSPFDIEAPKLQSDVQFSPVRPNKQTSPLRRNQPDIQDQEDENQTQRFPHTPRYGAGGVLLRTPGQVSRTANRYSNHGYEADQQQQQNQSNLQLDDSEQTPNISPPVTLNFATANNLGTSNLRKTPAREAAQNIVKDILNNVSGVNDSGISGFEEFGASKIRQFDETTSDQQDSLFNETDQEKKVPKPSTVLEGQEFDDFLDKKYRDFEKNSSIDWSDDDK